MRVHEFARFSIRMAIEYGVKGKVARRPYLDSQSYNHEGHRSYSNERQPQKMLPPGTHAVEANTSHGLAEFFVATWPH